MVKKLNAQNISILDIDAMNEENRQQTAQIFLEIN